MRKEWLRYARPRAPASVLSASIRDGCPAARSAHRRKGSTRRWSSLTRSRRNLAPRRAAASIRVGPRVVPSHLLSLTHSRSEKRIASNEKRSTYFRLYPRKISGTFTLELAQLRHWIDVGVGCEETSRRVPNNGRNERRSNEAYETWTWTSEKSHEYHTSQQRWSNWNAAVGRGPYITAA